MVAPGKNNKNSKNFTFVEKVEANLEENYSFVQDLKNIRTLGSFFSWFGGNINKLVEDYSQFLNSYITQTGLTLSHLGGCWFVGCLLHLFISVVQMAFGFSNLDSCPAQPLIPIFLACQGTVNLLSWLVEFLISALLQVFENRGYIKTSPMKDANFNIVKLTKYIWFGFSLAWLIAGSIWVFGTQPDFKTEELPSYCDEYVYNNSVVWLITCYVIILLALWVLTIGVSLVFVNSVLLKKSKKSDKLVLGSEEISQLNA